MSGIYTRQIYDQDAFEENTRRMTAQLARNMDIDFYRSPNACLAPGGPRTSYSYDSFFKQGGTQMDLDSALKNLGKINSKSNAKQFPYDLSEFNNTSLQPLCSNRIEPEYSRFIAPVSTTRGVDITALQFDYPLFDPQCAIFEPFGVDTKQLAKDSFVAPFVAPIDQSRALPKPRNQKLRDLKNCRVNVDCN